MRDRTDGQHVGLVAAATSGTHVELGIWVRPDRWSTGVGSEALLAVLPELNARFPLHLPVAEADVHHSASDRLLHSVGFRRHQQGTGRYGNRGLVLRLVGGRHMTLRPSPGGTTGQPDEVIRARRRGEDQRVGAPR